MESLCSHCSGSRSMLPQKVHVHVYHTFCGWGILTINSLMRRIKTAESQPSWVWSASKAKRLQGYLLQFCKDRPNSFLISCWQKLTTHRHTQTRPSTSAAAVLLLTTDKYVPALLTYSCSATTFVVLSLTRVVMYTSSALNGYTRPQQFSGRFSKFCA